MTDHDLLHRYVQGGAQDAFSELVCRHVALVYSAARRQVRSPQLAEEVTQSVFFDLARSARRLRPDQPLGAWLYVVTRRTAIDVIRRESRRQTREQTAVEVAAMNSPPTHWPQVEPHLDEAMESLGDVDRRAVLLRFFENQSLRDVGLALGITEDAAQKRVSRAIEQLRLFFARRGVAVGSAALATDLTAHAVQAAPAGLGATIASAAAAFSGAGGPTTICGATKTIAMTTIQKAAIAATLTVAVTAGLYEAQVISRHNTERQALQQRLDDRQRQLRSLQAERDDNARRLAAARQQLEADRARAANALASADPAMESALDSWLQNVANLRQRLEQMPDKKIPELQFLTARDWLDAAKDLKIDSEMDVRRALSELRRMAKFHFIPQLTAAFRRYLEANSNQPPGEATQLAPYFETPVDLAILQRYGAPSAGQSNGLVSMEGEVWAIREKAPVDNYYDTAIAISNRGNVLSQYISEFRDEVPAAIKAFEAANNGQRPTDPSQLAPYFHSIIDTAFVQQRLGGK